MIDEVTHLDATGQAALVRTRQIKPEELLEAAITRIELHNPRINAVITTMYDDGLRLVSGEPREGPFAYVPFLLKDLGTHCQGARLTEGSRFLADYRSDHDSQIVTRIKQAGLIIIGKTNTPEFGILGTTEPERFGPTRNPWNLGRSVGGSSGGAAAAVAASFVPMSHGSDGGGSIRIPAACCGVFGLKPTRGRNPLGPDHGEIFGGLVAEHALTRSVRDSARLLDATSGPDVGDPYWAPAIDRPFIEEVAREPGRLRIATSTQSPTGSEVHPDCVAATADVARLCHEAGHEVIEGRPDVDPQRLSKTFDTIWRASIAATIDGWAVKVGAAPRSDALEPLTWALYESGKRIGAADYIRAVDDLQAIARQVGEFFRDTDVWLTPTVSQPPPVLGWFDWSEDEPMRGYRRDSEFCPFPPIANITGQPSMSMPLYWNSENLPIGVQFTGRFGEESTLFRLASQLESARPWSGRLTRLLRPESE